MPRVKPMKSNDLGALLEGNVKEALLKRGSVFWRLHTIRSWHGVSNPCDFIVLDRSFTALLECKATNDDKFSCSVSSIRQMKHFENSVKVDHKGIYGIIVYFHSENYPKYVFASDQKVIENRTARRPIRPNVENSYNSSADTLDELLEELWREEGPHI